MRAVVLVLLPLLLALAVGSGVPQLNDPAEDYLFLTENDPNRVEQAQQVAARKAGVAYGDMKDAGATTFVTNYAVNITIPIANPALPTSPVGTYVQQMSVAELTVDVLLTTAKYAASATAASLLPQPVTLDGYTKFYDSYPHLPIGLQSPGAWRTDAFFGQLFLTYFRKCLLSPAPWPFNKAQVSLETSDSQAFVAKGSKDPSSFKKTFLCVGSHNSFTHRCERLGQSRVACAHDKHHQMEYVFFPRFHSLHCCSSSTYIFFAFFLLGMCVL